MSPAWVTLAPRSIAILVAAPIWPFNPPMMSSRMIIYFRCAFTPIAYDWPALMISVMVTPSRSSTSTTSPRATRRLLT